MSTDLLIAADELQASLQQKALRIVDCRFELLNPEAGKRAYRDGHIPGAVYADLDADLAGPVAAGTGRHPLPDPLQLCETLGGLGIDSDTEVILYDAESGALAARAWWLLRWIGHEKSRLLNGGLAAWTRAGYELEQGEVTVARKALAGDPRGELVLDTAEIVSLGCDAAALNLVDARESARFSGRQESIDPVAGHVPGARNLPYAANLDARGMWKPPDQLAANLRNRGRLEPGDEWSVMCGSGVTACHLALAGLLAGYREPRVYVGSWSEWIVDASRPVVTGDDEYAEYP